MENDFLEADTVILHGFPQVAIVIYPDFGKHITGYVTFVVSSMNQTPDAPARICFTFGEVPSEMATPFDPYPGGLSRSWLQDELVTVMTVPDTIPRRLAFRYVKVELEHPPSYDFVISHIECRAVTSASSTPPPLPATAACYDQEYRPCWAEYPQGMYADCV